MTKKTKEKAETGNGAKERILNLPSVSVGKCTDEELEWVMEEIRSVVPSGSEVREKKVTWSMPSPEITSIPLSFHVVDAQKNVSGCISSQSSSSSSALEEGEAPFVGTLRNEPLIQCKPPPSVPQGETLWRSKESEMMDKLQEKYEKLLGSKIVPFYEELKGGELFRAVVDVHYRVYKGDVDSKERQNLRHSTSMLDWVWEQVNVGDILMYVSKEKDDDGEVTPKWIITDSKTGEARIRDLYIASYKLEKCSHD